MATDFLDPVLSPIFQPLLNKSPFLAVLILAFLITVIITVIYKYATNQTEMKRLKDEQKEYQKRMKGMKDRPDEMMKVQKEAMKKQMDYFKHSMKAMLITFLPIILIFGWMSAHLAYEPIYPGETFSITAQFEDGVTGDATLLVFEGTEILSEATQKINSGVTWDLKSSAGEHDLVVKVGDDEQTKQVLITKDVEYTEEITSYDHSDIKSIKVNYKKLKPLGGMEIFGWKPGWLGIYIVFSILFSVVLRKLMKVY